MWAWVTRICLSVRPRCGETAVDAADLVAGIDDDGFAGFLVAQDGAVALQRADGKGLEDHGFIVERGWRGSAKRKRQTMKVCLSTDVDALASLFAGLGWR